MLRRRAPRPVRKAAKAEAARALPAVEELRLHVERSASAVREEYSELPGFPPSCPRCERIMHYRKTQLARKKWRWMWNCPGCGHAEYDAALRASAS
jgi:hypothetical protein